MNKNKNSLDLTCRSIAHVLLRLDNIINIRSMQAVRLRNSAMYPAINKGIVVKKYCFIMLDTNIVPIAKY